MSGVNRYPVAVEGMARFGINPRNTFGVLRARQSKGGWGKREIIVAGFFGSRRL